jgi:hypothetical protein
VTLAELDAALATLKRQGVKPGVPDICLPVPRRHWHGLWLELKTPKSATSRAGVVSADQKAWLSHLAVNDYRAEVCWGWEAARATILDYLGAKIT